MAPPVGLEPTTCGLTVRRSTDWAKGALCWHYLSSRQVTLQVLSARTSLTSVFGMGTGGPSPQSIPTSSWLSATLCQRLSSVTPCSIYLENWTLCSFAILLKAFTEPALWSSFRLISISQLHTLLRFHLWPINDIVYVEPQWRSYLRGSFTLRCLQRLSRPYVATQLCPWQDNWCTRGMSIPVLSY